MTNATFFNWSDEAFTGYWDGKPKTFAPGAKQLMPAWLAEHFAKHLTNRELLKQGKDTATSPKFPEQVPAFMELFNKAFIPDAASAGEGSIDEIISSASVEEPSMNITSKDQTPIQTGSPAAAQAAADATVIAGPDDEEESGFALGAN
jgi:hypothetical protein